MPFKYVPTFHSTHISTVVAATARSFLNVLPQSTSLMKGDIDTIMMRNYDYTSITVALASVTAVTQVIRNRQKIIRALFQDIPMYILTEHRSAVVTIFGLPLSLLWDCALKVRASYIQCFKCAPHLHDARVRNIQYQVQNRKNKEAPLCTARPGWASVSLSYRNYKKQWNAIDMPLYDILDIDTDNCIVRVEPFVSIGQLTRTLNPMGYTLPVVPEMDDLTVGGLINGTGIESSSHKYGLFHEIITELELILGDGRVIIATADNEYADLFHAVPWSYGTLALLLSAKLKLIPCKEYVKLTYTPHHSKESYIEQMRQLSGEYGTGNNETLPMFVEGLAFSLDTAVIMSGDFVDAKDVPRGAANHLSRWWKPWFYTHVREMLHNAKGETSTICKVEYIPLRDYYHRHTQSLFWEMELMIPIGNNVVFRWLLGWLMPPKVSFLKISQTEMTRQLVERTHVAQDFLVPTRKMSEFLDLCDREFDRIYPLWLCLHSHAAIPGSLLKPPLQPGKDGSEMYVDIGVYGLPRCVHEKREEDFDMKKSMRNVLKYLVTLDGFQMLYADVFSTREEFEEMFDHTRYRELRKKYNSEHAFKEVYDKMSVIL
jgi:delta24-sterol reductase